MSAAMVFGLCPTGTWSVAVKAAAVELPKDLHTIGKNAFKGCKSLMMITMGEDIETIGKGAFKNIKKKCTIKIDADRGDFTAIKKLIKKSGVSGKIKYKRI